MSITACCPTDRPAVVAHYTPKGTMLPNGAYVTGPTNSKFGLITIHDIFGMTAQNYQVADLISSYAGAQMYVPDIFINGAFPVDATPEQWSNLMNWIKENGDWEKAVVPKLNEVSAQHELMPVNIYSHFSDSH